MVQHSVKKGLKKAHWGNIKINFELFLIKGWLHGELPWRIALKTKEVLLLAVGLILSPLWGQYCVSAGFITWISSGKTSVKITKHFHWYVESNFGWWFNIANKSAHNTQNYNHLILWTLNDIFDVFPGMAALL